MKPVSGYFHLSRQFYYLLVDPDGNTRSVNQLFLEEFGTAFSAEKPVHIASLLSPADAVQFLWIIRNCLRNPESPMTVKLRLRNNTGKMQTIDWECSACTSENGLPMEIQCIATAVSCDTGIEPAAPALPALERYMALERSAEGLWMFVTNEPLDLQEGAEKVINSWKENAYLVECNDNMARMYGFDKAEELIGIKLGDIIDFSDLKLYTGFRRFVESGFTTTTIETREFDRHGNVKYFLNRMTGIVESGKLKRVWGTQQDITAQRQAEEKLRESELFFRTLFVNSLDGIVITDEKGVITFASPSVTPILGYETAEVLGKNIFSFAHPEDRELAKKAFVVEQQHETNIEFISLRVRRKTGEWMWCIIRGHSLFGNPILKGMVVNFYNDTVRKRTEKALQESEKRFRNQAIILDNVTDVIVTTDLERNVTSWNHVAEALTGIPASEVIGKPFRYLTDTSFHPFTNEQVISIVSTKGIWRGELGITGNDGEYKHVLTTISLLRDEQGRRFGLLAVGKDISDRKKAEDKLQESELFYRNLTANSLDGIVFTNDEGTITYCSPSIRKIAGYEAEQLMGKPIFQFVHPDDVRIALEAFSIEYRKESQINYLNLRLLHSNGEWVWCTVRGHNLMDHPVFHSMVIYFTNDSKRKAIEDKLRDSERRFRSLVQNVQMGVTLRDPGGKLIMANKAAEEMLGQGIDELDCAFDNHQEWSSIYEDGTPMPVESHPVPVSIRTGSPVRGVVMGVYRKKFNDRVWIMVNTEPIMDNEGRLTYVICSFMDITEQKRLAQQLIEQEIQKQNQLTQATIDAQEKERIEIGKELHDNINQHLNTTRLYLEVALDKTSGDVQEMIHLAHKNLSGIINEIRQISQSLVPPTLGDIGLAESVKDLCGSLQRAHKFNIEFNCRHFDEENIPANLLLSLFRIIQEKISNIIRHSEATQISIRLQSDAEYIFLTIIDNGKGFDPTNVKLGLGLNNIRTRTALFNGKMTLQSSPGGGCELSVIIPHHRESGAD